jgi:hypothetical protein
MSCRKILTKDQLADLNWTSNVFFGHFLYAEESDPRSSAEKIPGLAAKPSFGDVLSATCSEQDRSFIVRWRLNVQSRSLACGSG